MRVLLKISMPVEKGNEAYQSGALTQTIQSLAEMVTPEAMYFYPEAGRRTAMLVFDMEGSWQLPSLVEPLFENLNASVEVTPVMTIEDLQRGMAEAAAK